MQTYRIVYNDNGREIGRTPLTVPSETHRGRCLICNPSDGIGSAGAAAAARAAAAAARAAAAAADGGGAPAESRAQSLVVSQSSSQEAGGVAARNDGGRGAAGGRASGTGGRDAAAAPPPPPLARGVPGVPVAAAQQRRHQRRQQRRQQRQEIVVPAPAAAAAAAAPEAAAPEATTPTQGEGANHDSSPPTPPARKQVGGASTAEAGGPTTGTTTAAASSPPQEQPSSHDDEEDQDKSKNNDGDDDDRKMPATSTRQRNDLGGTRRSEAHSSHKKRDAFNGGSDVQKPNSAVTEEKRSQKEPPIQNEGSAAAQAHVAADSNSSIADMAKALAESQLKPRRKNSSALTSPTSGKSVGGGSGQNAAAAAKRRGDAELKRGPLVPPRMAATASVAGKSPTSRSAASAASAAAVAANPSCGDGEPAAFTTNGSRIIVLDDHCIPGRKRESPKIYPDVDQTGAAAANIAARASETVSALQVAPLCPSKKVVSYSLKKDSASKSDPRLPTKASRRGGDADAGVAPSSVSAPDKVVSVGKSGRPSSPSPATPRAKAPAAAAPEATTAEASKSKAKGGLSRDLDTVQNPYLGKWIFCHQGECRTSRGNIVTMSPQGWVTIDDNSGRDDEKMMYTDCTLADPIDPKVLERFNEKTGCDLRLLPHLKHPYLNKRVFMVQGECKGEEGVIIGISEGMHGRVIIEAHEKDGKSAPLSDCRMIDPVDIDDLRDYCKKAGKYIEYIYPIVNDDGVDNGDVGVAPSSKSRTTRRTVRSSTRKGGKDKGDMKLVEGPKGSAGPKRTTKRKAKKTLESSAAERRNRSKVASRYPTRSSDTVDAATSMSTAPRVKAVVGDEASNAVQEEPVKKHRNTTPRVKAAGGDEASNAVQEEPVKKRRNTTPRVKAVVGDEASNAVQEEPVKKHRNTTPRVKAVIGDEASNAVQEEPVEKRRNTTPRVKAVIGDEASNAVQEEPVKKRRSTRKSSKPNGGPSPYATDPNAELNSTAIGGLSSRGRSSMRRATASTAKHQLLKKRRQEPDLIDVESSDKLDAEEEMAVDHDNANGESDDAKEPPNKCRKTSSKARESIRERNIKSAVHNASLAKNKARHKAQMTYLKSMHRTCTDATGGALIVKHGGVEAILAAMRALPTCLDVQSTACKTLVNIIYHNHRAYHHTNREIYPDVLRAMRSCINTKSIKHAQVNHYAIGVLQQLAIIEDLKHTIIASGCLDQVIMAMQSFRAYPWLQENGCLFLQDLTRHLQSHDDAITVLKSGALKCLLAVLRTYTGTEITETALGAIANSFFHEDAIPAKMKREVLIDMNLIDILATTVKSDSPKVVIRTCNVLNNIATEDLRINEAIIDADFIPETTEAMRRFHSNRQVQQLGSLFFGNLCYGNIETRAEMVKAEGGSAAIIDCLRTHVMHSGVMREALAALRNVAHPEKVNALTTVSYIVIAMDTHPEDRSVQEHGCMLLLQVSIINSFCVIGCCKPV